MCMCILNTIIDTPVSNPLVLGFRERNHVLTVHVLEICHPLIFSGPVVGHVDFL